ncbi:MAG TPA: alpha/beta fold hydrolase [Candidatus Binatia bacterium]|nr:alpha/beta fold hydrolase [Candidatus Binatia bacterium]
MRPIFFSVALLFFGRTALAAQPVEVAFPSGSLTLKGFIYKPEGSGPFPAILYSHGSERLPGEKPEIGNFFAPQGYALFVPHRRGHGRSPADSRIDSLYDRGAAGVVALHEVHLEDTLAALAYLRAQPFVDTRRIAAAGCSYGGIQTLLLAGEKGTGIGAAIAFAAAAETWSRSRPLQSRLTRAAKEATAPILFIQAENDWDLTPSLVLAREMEGAGRPHKRVIFPAHGQTHEDGHGGFCFKATHIWGAEVAEFLSASLAR